MGICSIMNVMCLGHFSMVITFLIFLFVWTQWSEMTCDANIIVDILEYTCIIEFVPPTLFTVLLHTNAV